MFEQGVDVMFASVGSYVCVERAAVSLLNSWERCCRQGGTSIVGVWAVSGRGER